MINYKKPERMKDSVITVRVPTDLKNALTKLKFNISKICRDALENFGKEHGIMKGKRNV